MQHQSEVRWRHFWHWFYAGRVTAGENATQKCLKLGFTEHRCTLIMPANTMQRQPAFSLTGSCVSVFNLNNQLCLQRPSVRRHRTIDVSQPWHQNRLLQHTRAFWILPSELIVPQQRETWIWDSREVTPHIHISAATQPPLHWLQHTHGHICMHIETIHSKSFQTHKHAAPLCVCVCVLWWCLRFVQPDFFFFSLTWWGKKAACRAKRRAAQHKSCSHIRCTEAIRRKWSRSGFCLF